MAKSKVDPAIWFDGVDPKLLTAHTSKPAPAITDSDERTLVTNDSLATLASYTKKIINKEKTPKTNGTQGSQKRQSNAPDAINKKFKMSNGISKDTIKPHTGITEELAIDCEMVECYHNTSVLARVSIVNLFGHPIFDKYVAPPAKVTDYRTKYSGIRRRDLIHGYDFDTVQKEVANLIDGRIVIGHAIHNDFQVLKLSHPPELTRDTSIYFRYLFQGKTPSLKKLCESLLGVKIQKGEHNSVQDAQATMKLYVLERDKWNDMILKGDLKSTVANPNQYQRPKSNKQKTKPKKKKIKTFWVMN